MGDPWRRSLNPARRRYVNETTLAGQKRASPHAPGGGGGKGKQEEIQAKGIEASPKFGWWGVHREPYKERNPEQFMEGP